MGGGEGGRGVTSLLDDEEEEEGVCEACACGCRREGRRKGGREGGVSSSSPSLLVRMIDDYLFVSATRWKAEAFLEKVYAALPAVGKEGGRGGREGRIVNTHFSSHLPICLTGMRVHPHKTKTNFACTVRVKEGGREGGREEEEEEEKEEEEEERVVEIEPAVLPVLVRKKEGGKEGGKEGR